MISILLKFPHQRLLTGLSSSYPISADRFDHRSRKIKLLHRRERNDCRGTFDVPRGIGFCPWTHGLSNTIRFWTNGRMVLAEGFHREVFARSKHLHVKFRLQSTMYMKRESATSRVVARDAHARRSANVACLE